MKFDYISEQQGPREVVAYIDVDGDLRLPQVDCDNSRAIGFGSTCSKAYVGLEWDPHRADVKKRFYAGDTITITF